jgi:hypothetical protein
MHGERGLTPAFITRSFIARREIAFGSARIKI